MDEVKALLDSFPEDKLEPEFDSFFVGEGSKKLLDGYRDPRSFSDQLLAGFKGVSVPVKDDVSRFDGETLDVEDDSIYEELFLKYKEKAFARFDYLKVKSASIGSVPVSEKDLVVGDEDRRLIEALKFLTQDYFAIASVATLAAFDEMGIFNVKFVEQDGCALCKAFDGMVLNVREAIERLQDKGITHRYCECDFFPLVQRKYVYEKLRDKDLNIEELEVGGKIVLNVPVEVRDDLLELVRMLPNEVVEFINMVEYVEDHLSDDYINVVVYEDEEGLLFVDNNYTQDGRGPVDFLKAYVEMMSGEECADVGAFEGLETLYYKGHAVVYSNGKYWDKRTGRRVE